MNPCTLELTARQKEALAFINHYLASFGVPPTLREIAKAMGIGSTNGANDHLRGLIRKGYLQEPRHRGMSRGYLPTNPLDQRAALASLMEENLRLRACLHEQDGALAQVVALLERERSRL